ncbi:MAG: hypothetical protein J2P45_14460 [Candidatus Dormibacteraeota bacterium]|nr:hypothetical protein [Candidatus Dormibacteraeota bacterium]
MAVRKHHHLPAAVIGRFGGSHPDGLRYALIAVRQKKRKSKAQLSTAEAIAREPDLYRPTSLPAGVEPEQMERLWERIERPLVDSLSRLEAGGHTEDDQDLVFSYLAALGVRRPGALEKVARPRWGTVRHEQGLGDQLRQARLLVLRNTLSMIRSLRWRMLEAPPDAPRYVVNDLGFTVISEWGRKGEALFVPVGPRLALLGFQHRPTDLRERVYAAPWTVRWLNAATWTQETAKAVFGHPDDLEMLMELRRVRRVKKSPWGPYRDRRHTLMGD